MPHSHESRLLSQRNPYSAFVLIGQTVSMRQFEKEFPLFFQMFGQRKKKALLYFNIVCNLILLSNKLFLF